MTDETRPNRGEAAWKEQREAVAKRNVEAHKRGKAERELKERSNDARVRARAVEEAHELHELNARIADRRSGTA